MTFDTVAPDNSVEVPQCCNSSQKAILLLSNTIAGFFHLALTFTLLITIAFLEDTDDDSLRTTGLIISIIGYITLAILPVVKATNEEDLGYGCLAWFVTSFGATMSGIICLSSYIQQNIKGVFPILLSTQYNHPPIIPAPFDSNVINFTNFPGDVSRTTPPCKTTAYSADEFVDWFKCIRKSEWKEDMKMNEDFFLTESGRLFPKGNWVEFKPFGDTTIYLWWGVVAFCLITTIFHFMLAWGVYANDEDDAEDDEKENCNCSNCSVPYYTWIKNGRQPMRWAEYSITASIMIVLVLVINRVTDVYQIIYSFILMELINSFGAGIDYVNNPLIVLWFWFCSGSAFVWQFVLIFNTYFNTIKPYVTRTEDFTADELWGGLFGFITPLNYAIFFSFMTFAITNVVHQCFRFQGCFHFPRCCVIKAKKEVEKEKRTLYMFWAELTYIILSFVSKGLLVIIVSVGATAREQ